MILKFNELYFKHKVITINITNKNTNDNNITNYYVEFIKNMNI
jgi:hypothetical protein